MAGIQPIAGALSRGFVTPPRHTAEANGSRFADALGTKSGLGESSFIDSVRDENPSGREGIAGVAGELTDEEQRKVQELKQRDREVRQHEQAHVAAAGRYAQGGPQYEFTAGPDGRRYATGGHVNIDVSPAATPEATIQKAQVIRRAALAPAQPSGEDRAVATEASQLEAEARRELRETQQEDGNKDRGSSVEAAPISASGPGAVDTIGALEPPAPLSRREIAQYEPQPAEQPPATAIPQVSQLDLLA